MLRYASSEDRAKAECPSPFRHKKVPPAEAGGTKSWWSERDLNPRHGDFQADRGGNLADQAVQNVMVLWTDLRFF